MRPGGPRFACVVGLATFGASLPRELEVKWYRKRGVATHGVVASAVIPVNQGARALRRARRGDGMRRYRAAVFLDRDGTVIEEAHYLSDPGQVRLIPGTGPAIAALNRAGIAAVLVTNQSGVARGYFDEERVHAVHDRLGELLAQEGARLDAVFYCPHLEQASVESFRRDCECRKPRPGMVEAARERLELHGLPSYVVGDKALDLELGRVTGATAILVRTGYGARIEAGLVGEAAPDQVVDRLEDAVAWILEREAVSSR